MIALKQYLTEGGVKTALVKEGRKWDQVITMESNNGSSRLLVRRVPKTEEHFMIDLTRNGKPYPMSRAMKVFRSYGRRFGMSRTAKKILREV